MVDIHAQWSRIGARVIPASTHNADNVDKAVKQYLSLDVAGQAEASSKEEVTKDRKQVLTEVTPVMISEEGQPSPINQHIQACSCSSPSKPSLMAAQQSLPKIAQQPSSSHVQQTHSSNVSKATRTPIKLKQKINTLPWCSV